MIISSRDVSKNDADKAMNISFTDANAEQKNGMHMKQQQTIAVIYSVAECRYNCQIIIIRYE